MDASQIQLVNNTSIFRYGNLYPKIDKSVFIAPGVKIVGDVEIAKNSSVWFNSVIRGDVHYVKIGEMTNVQDLCMLHVTNGKYPLNIGHGVTVGHSVKLHGCTVYDSCLIGIGAVVLDGAVVNENSIVAAGAVVKPNFVVPKGKIVGGVPARILRDLTDDEKIDIKDSALRYFNYSELMNQSLFAGINED